MTSKFLLVFFLIAITSVCASNLPNIVLILTDDQDMVLNSLDSLEKVQKLLINKGSTFSSAFASSPICCPSRSSILTGLYAHNTQTFNNSVDGGCYSENWKKNHESQTFPALLHKSGYETFFAGKYLNEYYSKDVPAGWSHWFGLHGNSKYYNYTLNENGVLKDYKDGQNDYLTTVIKDHTLNFFTKRNNSKVPFFAMLSLPACHAPFTPEEKYKDHFKYVKALRTKNFNIGAEVNTKHWLMTMEPRTLPDEIISSMDHIFHSRWETLLSVDDLVEDVVLQLNKQNVIDETYIIFTSDNGYHIGQWAMPKDKRLPYETDIRVPLIIRGPNVPSKSYINTPVLLIDLAPTILNWAKVRINSANYDGVPLDDVIAKASINDTEIVERKFLVEYWGEGNRQTYNPDCPWKARDQLNQCNKDSACKCEDSWNNTYSCVRHLATDLSFIFCEFDDHESYHEAYDLLEDSDQMENIAYDILPSVQAKYSLNINHLKNCHGDNCRNIE